MVNYLNRGRSRDAKHLRTPLLEVVIMTQSPNCYAAVYTLVCIHARTTYISEMAALDRVRVLVTGATGLLGRQIVEVISSDAKFEVIVRDYYIPVIEYN